MNVDNVTYAIARFNGSIESAEKASEFNDAIESLKASREHISHMEHVVKEMKQIEHNLTQNVYNKFKNKNYVKSIKFI